MSALNFREIKVQGTPYECGRQYGLQAKDLIEQNMQNYYQLWADIAMSNNIAVPQHDLFRTHILDKAREFVDRIGEYDAGIMEEINGIAEGSGFSLEEIVALNARYEICALPVLQSITKGGCTSVCALPEVTGDGHTLIGQNWDLWSMFKGLSVILQIEQQGKPAVVTLAEAGIVAHRGMNSTGIGSCFNALSSNWDIDEARTPFLVIARGILNSANLSEAIKKVAETTTCASGNFLLASAEGQTIDLEITPRDIAAIYEHHGILTHSNHFMEMTTRTGLKDNAWQLFPDSLLRWHRARKLLKTEPGKISIESVQNVFRDHASYPTSICRHADDKRDPKLQVVTVSSVVMDLNERTFYIADGNPCENEYVKFAPDILRK